MISVERHHLRKIYKIFKNNVNFKKYSVRIVNILIQKTSKINMTVSKMSVKIQDILDQN